MQSTTNDSAAPYRAAWLAFEKQHRLAGRIKFGVFALMFSQIFLHTVRWASVIGWLGVAVGLGALVRIGQGGMSCPRCRTPWVFENKMRGVSLSMGDLELTRCQNCGLKWAAESDDADSTGS